MAWNLVFWSLVAVFSVFGLVSAAQMIVEACFPLRQLTVMVELRTREDVEVLEMLLQEARGAFVRRRSAKVGVLLNGALCPDGEIPKDVAELLKRYGAECYVVED